MKAYRLMDVLGKVKEDYIMESAPGRTQKATNTSENTYCNQNNRNRNTLLRRALLIAAIIATLLLLVGCVAVMLGLNKLVIGTFIYNGMSGETKSGDFISLQGYIDSDSYKAAQEWNRYLDQYDPDGSLLKEAEEIEFIPPIDYMAYQCYTPDMVKKIDDICSKYHLELLGPTYGPTRLTNASTEILTPLGIDSITATGPDVGVSLSNGYYYRDGSFALEGNLVLSDNDNLLSGCAEFQYRCVMKTSFDGVALNIGNAESFDQWNYKVTDGTDVLLALSENKALIIADGDSSFITINILTQHMTRAELEAAADAFIFTYSPQRPDPGTLVEPEWYPEETALQETEQEETEPTNYSSEGTAELLNSDEQILWQVLQNQASFHSVSYGKACTLAEYCASESELISVEISAFRYALVDMDHDGIREAVVDFRFGENSQVMCMVLKWDGSNEIIYGKEFYYRQMYQIKKDGSFAYSGGVGNNGWAQLRWDNGDWVIETVEDGSQKSDVQWYAYPVIVD